MKFGGNDFDVSVLQELISYDPETGDLRQRGFYWDDWA
jgi:hypothetical protein